MKIVFIFLPILFFATSGWSKSFTVFEDLYKWDKNSVEVCWGTIDRFISVNHSLGKKVEAQGLPSLPSEFQKLIQKKVQSQFTLELTGIEFTGWQACTERPSADIIVYGTSLYKENNSYPSGSADIGMAEVDLKTKRTRKGFVFLNQFYGAQENSSTEKLLLTALHEFGHAAALRHEHIRGAADDDENCQQRILNYGEMDREYGFMDTAKYIGKYDPISIMNYCYNWYQKNRQGFNSLDDIRLSPQDRQTLMCMYKPNKLPPGSCETKLLDNDDDKLLESEKNFL